MLSLSRALFHKVKTICMCFLARELAVNYIHGEGSSQVLDKYWVSLFLSYIETHNCYWSIIRESLHVTHSLTRAKEMTLHPTSTSEYLHIINLPQICMLL